MYTQKQIDHAKMQRGMSRYTFALNVYNRMPLASRKKLLAKHGHSKVYAHRTFGYLFKNIRDDLIPAILKGDY